MRARPKSHIFRSQFSLTRMLLGFRSRWMTPAEWRYFRPRWNCWWSEDRACWWVGIDDTNHYLIYEVLDELVFDPFGFQNCVKVGCHKFSHKVSNVISTFNARKESVGSSYMSSEGEMKISVRLIILRRIRQLSHTSYGYAHVFMSQLS